MRVYAAAALAFGALCAAAGNRSSARKALSNVIDSFGAIRIGKSSPIHSTSDHQSTQSIVYKEETVVSDEKRNCDTPRCESNDFTTGAINSSSAVSGDGVSSHEDRHSAAERSHHGVQNIFNLQVNTSQSIYGPPLRLESSDSCHTLVNFSSPSLDIAHDEFHAERIELFDITRLDSSSRSLPSERSARVDPYACVRRSFYRGRSERCASLFEYEDTQRTLMVDEAIDFLRTPPLSGRTPHSVFKVLSPLCTPEEALRRVILFSSESIPRNTLSDTKLSDPLHLYDISIKESQLAAISIAESTRSTDDILGFENSSKDDLRTRLEQLYDRWVVTTGTLSFAAVLVAEVARSMAAAGVSFPTLYVSPADPGTLHMPLTDSEAHILAAAIALFPADRRHKSEYHAIALAAILGFRMYTLVGGGLQRGPIAGILSAALGVPLEIALNLTVLADALGVSDAAELAHMAVLWRAWPLNRNDPNAPVDSERVFRLILESPDRVLFETKMYDTPVFGAGKTTSFGDVWQHSLAVCVAASQELWPKDSFVHRMYNCVEEALYFSELNGVRGHADTPSLQFARVRDALTARRMLQSYEVLCSEIGRDADAHDAALVTPIHRDQTRRYSTHNTRSLVHPHTGESMYTASNDPASSFAAGHGNVADSTRGIFIAENSATMLDAKSLKQDQSHQGSTHFVRLDRDVEYDNEMLRQSFDSLQSDKLDDEYLRKSLSGSASERNHVVKRYHLQKGRANPALPPQKLLFMERLYTPAFDGQMRMAATLGIWTRLDALLLARSGALACGVGGTDVHACSVLAMQIEEAAKNALPFDMPRIDVTLQDILSAQDNPVWAAKIARFGALGLWEYISALENWARVKGIVSKRKKHALEHGNLPKIVATHGDFDFNIYKLAIAYTGKVASLAFPAFAAVFEFLQAHRRRSWCDTVEVREILLHVNGVLLPGDDHRHMTSERDVNRIIWTASHEAISTRVPLRSALNLALALRYVVAHWISCGSSNPPTDLPFRALRSLNVPHDAIETAEETVRALDMSTNVRSVAVAVVYAVLEHTSGSLCPMAGFGAQWRTEFINRLKLRQRDSDHLTAFLAAKDGASACIGLTTFIEVQNAITAHTFAGHHGFNARLFGPIAAAAQNSRLLVDDEDEPTLGRAPTVAPSNHNTAYLNTTSTKHPVLDAFVSTATIALHLNALNYPVKIVRSVISRGVPTTIERFIAFMASAMSSDMHEANFSNGYAVKYDSLRSLTEAFAGSRQSTLGRSFARLTHLYSTISADCNQTTSANNEHSATNVISNPPLMRQGAHNAQMLSPYVMPIQSQGRFERYDSSSVSLLLPSSDLDSHSLSPSVPTSSETHNPPVIGRQNSNLGGNSHHPMLLRAGTMQRSSLHVLRELESDKTTSFRNSQLSKSQSKDKFFDEGLQIVAGRDTLKPSNFVSSESGCNCSVC